MADKKEKYTEHPSLVVINGTPRLRVFEDFFIEEDLPKWKKIAVKIKEEDEKKKDYGDRVDYSPIHSGTGAITDSRSERNLLSNAKYERRNYIERPVMRTSQTEKKSWFRKMLDSLSDIKDRGAPVAKVFDEAKTVMMSPTNEDVLKAQKLVFAAEHQLRVSGQYELADRVHATKGVLEAEITLVNAGSLKYISEEQVVSLMLKSEKGIRLEYLRYYSNILPTDVAKKKILFDGLLVFDNYCVLYYDPGTAKFSIVKEKEDDAARRARRDPILFGMIKGSRKLYYIADWVTADDDLTLDKLETIIGEKAFDIGKQEFATTGVQIDHMLSRLTVDVGVDVEQAARDGRLLTETNVIDFVTTGKIAPSIENLIDEAASKKVADKIPEVFVVNELEQEAGQEKVLTDARVFVSRDLGMSYLRGRYNDLKKMPEKIEHDEFSEDGWYVIKTETGMTYEAYLSEKIRVKEESKLAKDKPVEDQKPEEKQ